MEWKMTKRSREKINMPLLDACLLVAEDGQRPDAGEFIGYGSRNPAAGEQPQRSLLGRRRRSGSTAKVTSHPPCSPPSGRVVATAMVSQRDIDAKLVNKR
jgi:hypothetical protein